jgi:hypothetical protein
LNQIVSFGLKTNHLATLVPVIPVDRVVDKKRIIGKNGGPRRRRGTRVRCHSQTPPPPKKKNLLL